MIFKHPKSGQITDNVTEPIDSDAAEIDLLIPNSVELCSSLKFENEKTILRIIFVTQTRGIPVPMLRNSN